MRWILVERRYAEVVGEGKALDGRVNPDAVVLAFQPLFAEDLNWDAMVDAEEHFVEVVALEPSGPAAPGEIVSATVRVGRAQVNQFYRLRARPSQTDVRMVGETECIVRGKASAVFRFTSVTSGRGGIAVAVDRVD